MWIRLIFRFKDGVDAGIIVDGDDRGVDCVVLLIRPKYTCCVDGKSVLKFCDDVFRNLRCFHSISSELSSPTKRSDGKEDEENDDNAESLPLSEI